MRIAIVALGALTLLIPAKSFSQNDARATVSPNARAISNQKMPGKVPAKTEFALFDKDGKPISVLEAGRSTPPDVDCVLIDCPATFGKNVRCWKCK
jgi:hypothetical protein